MSEPVPRHRRNARRAYDKDGREMQPMDVRNARQNGVTSIEATCRCGHEAVVPIERFADDAPVPDLGLGMRCTACGGKDIDTRPCWAGARVPGHPGPDTKRPAAANRTGPTEQSSP